MGGSKSAGASAKSAIGFDLNLEKMERQFIREALDRSGNNRTEAAELLGLSRRTLQRKLKEMDMVRKKRKSEGQDPS